MNSKAKSEMCSWRPEGDMTIYSVAGYKEQLLAVLKRACNMEISLANVGEIDSAGMQLLILAKREAQKRNLALRITGHTAAVVEVMDLYNMTGFFGDPVIMPTKDQ